MESQDMHCGSLAIKVQTTAAAHDMITLSVTTGDHLVFLDPHTTQPTVRPSDLAHILDTSYHCNNPGYMKIHDIDPSIAVVTIS